jgi:DNA topoisomerase-3
MLVSILPPVATTPDMTAVWEAAMRRISEGQLGLEDFVGRGLAQVEQLVSSGRQGGPLRVPGRTVCPRPGCTGFVRRCAGRRGEFVGCTRYRDCGYTASTKTRATTRAGPAS